jgi:hypothetical protein
VNGRAKNGHPVNGHPVNGHALNGNALNGHALNGNALNGNAANGHPRALPRGAAGDGEHSSSPTLPGIEADVRGVELLPLRPGPVCRVCPLRATCRSICDVIEALLPSPERGRVDAEDLPRLHAGMRLRRALLDWMHILSPHQQEVVRLYYRESLMQNEIAARLGVSQQAVHDSLRRARHAIGEQILHGSRRSGRLDS